ncbi:MAG: PIN domain-containing protein [Gemmataceae bacterium]|nr:PIN domain-containing protein [Gemmataceae bacterium]
MTEFADSYALIAWLNPRDAAHAVVSEYLETFSGRLVTTEWVLMEVADGLSAPMHRPAVIDFLNQVRSTPLFEVVDYDRALYRDGFDLYSRRSDKGWSLTDCISFEVMARRRLTDALTADHHFEQAGFRAVFRA